MSRIVRSLFSFALLAGLLIAGGNTTGAVSPGVTRQPLATGRLDELPPAPALVGLARVTYDPGAVEQIGIGQYGDLVYVESGELTIRTDGIATVARAGATPAPLDEQVGNGAAFEVG